jgi:F-type H+-transporting ATPase subunit a
MLASGSPVDHVFEHLAPHEGLLGGLRTNTHLMMSLLASAFVVLVFVGLARRMKARGGAPSEGVLDNLLESFILFIRDEVVKPNMGPHAEHYAPFLLTVFFFVLVSNLMGLIPAAAAGTSNISITAGLALVTFGYGALHGVRAQGMGHYVKNLAPAGVPGFVLVILYPIEIVGLILKHGVLAVRLFFNMWAGHLVIGIILALPALMKVSAVTGPAYALAAGITFLELFVAFLQAYVFTMLASIFIGAQVHPEH